MAPKDPLNSLSHTQNVTPYTMATLSPWHIAVKHPYSFPRVEFLGRWGEGAVHGIGKN